MSRMRGGMLARRRGALHARAPHRRWLACAVAVCSLSVLLMPALAFAKTEAPVEPKPVNTEAPKLTGTPTVGSTLSCSQGAWANKPTAYAYAWLRSGVPIAGQSASTYVLQSVDAGHSVTCQVTASNAGGEYTISGLETGSYQVEFFGDEYDEGFPFQAQYFSGKTLSTEASLVSAVESTNTPGIDAVLAVGGQITGSVTAASGGAPLAGAEVCADDEAEDAIGYGCATSNAAGDYTITGLASGSYRVEADKYDSSNYLSTRTKGVSVNVPGTTVGVDLAMPSGGQIAGTVTAATGGEPLAEIEVCAEGKGGGNCATTGSNGEYTISKLLTGEYEVKFEREYNGGNFIAQTQGKVEVVTPATTTGVDAKMATGGEITGTVKAPGGGRPSTVQVCAELSSPFVSSCAYTNASGSYTLRGMPTSKSYLVRFSAFAEGVNYAPQYYEGSPTRAGATPVSVVAGAVTPEVGAEMQRGAQIGGTVTAASGGAAIAGAEVCAFGEETGGCTETDAGGEYAIADLLEGTYEVRFYPLDDKFELKESPNVLEQTRSGIAVAAGESRAGVDAALAPGAQISGRVTATSNGAALADVEVCANGEHVETNGCALTSTGGGATVAASNALTVADSSFALVKSPVFDARSGDLDFFLSLPQAGTLRWGLFFKNADVGFADSLGLSAIAGDPSSFGAPAAESAKAKLCKAGFTRHRRRCVAVLVAYASGSKIVPAGTVEIKVHADAKALRALRSGHTLHVSGRFSFQSVLGGSPVTHSVSTVIRPRRKRRRR